jgi:molybdopterin molybdotransferase
MPAVSELISVGEARARVLAAVPRSRGPEAVPVEQAAGRVLAENLRAAGDVPAFPNSAMDGYAVRAGPGGRRLRVSGESRAGQPVTAGPKEIEAVRISTGAALPPGADAVIRQEDTTEADGDVVLHVATRVGQNVRAAGEDMRAGEIALEAGSDLRAAAVALAVAAGVSELPCAPRPRMRILCTGDELRAPGAPLGAGEIHNSNAVGLAAMATNAGSLVLGAGIVPDTAGATEAALRDALEQADVVVVSGGVSVGPHDHVKPALAALGVEESFWRVSLRPGKPTWFGVAPGGVLVFGLPGNPVSALVTFRLFARPALRAMQGADPEPRAVRALLAEPCARQAREQALRVRLDNDGGAPQAYPASAQGSHQLKALAEADGLALIPPGEDELAAGEIVEVLLLD